MNTHSDQFKSPTLYYVICEDDDEFADVLSKSFDNYFEEWPFQPRHCVIERIFCKSIRSAYETIERLVQEDAAFYVTIDLNLPLHDGDEDDAPCRELVFWLLGESALLTESLGEPVRNLSAVQQRFRFCVMSAHETGLESFFSDSDLSDQLRDITRIFKKDLQGPGREAWLVKIWNRCKQLFLDEIDFCILGPETDGHAAPLTPMIWFGRGDTHPALAQLREKLSSIVEQNRSGLYLIFSEPTDYADDWFDLLCQLRGCTPERLKIVEQEPRRNPQWDRQLADPPEALLITQVERAHDVRCDLVRAFDENDFVEKLQKQNKLAFVLFSSGYADELRLDKSEREFLEECYRLVGADSASYLRLGRRPPHDRIIVFPGYHSLCETDVVENSLYYEMKIAQSHYDLAGVTVDPDVVAVLRNVEDSDFRGLYWLRGAIDEAYERTAEHRGGTADRVGIEAFSEAVNEEFRSSAGISVRGQRLVEVLKGGRDAQRHKVVSPASPLERLEGIHELLRSLDHLIRDARAADEHNRLEFTERFHQDEYQALEEAHKFLKFLFQSGEKLLAEIEAFRPYADGDDWETRFPSLLKRKDWQDLVADINFNWPVHDGFTLPRALSDYLAGSGIIAEMHTKREQVFRNYRHLLVQWREVQRQRKEVLEELQALENQKRMAREFIHDRSCAPVFALLDQPNNGLPLYLWMLESLIVYNAYLAVFENVQQFEGKFAKRAEVLDAIDLVQLGSSTTFLRNYLSRLRKADRLKESIFSKWRVDWTSGKKHAQPDAVRLGQELFDDLCGEFSFTADQKTRLEPLCRIADACPTVSLLEPLGLLRSKFCKGGKEDERFVEFKPRIWDLLRRFVASVTEPAFQLGLIEGGSSRLWIWTRRSLTECPRSDRKSDAPSGTWLFRGTNPSPYLFVHDLIRIGSDRSSVWTHYRPGEFCDISSVNLQPGDRERGGGPDAPWIPTRAEFEQSEIWRWANG